MKKLLGILMFILLVGTLSACDDNASNIIAAVDVSDREETILSTLTNQSFLFDFNNEDYEEVSMWVEKYEQGELVDDQLGYLTSPVDETGLIIFATKIDGVDEQQTFHIGVGDEDGVSSLTTRDENFEFLPAVYGDIPEEKTLHEGELVLADIAYSDDEFGISSISNSFYEDPEANMEELKEYDVVYLFKAEFAE
ncbi:hypothetical protein [Oceanobacillus sp. AG]|uniref:hypothetical protein n=1 Tax=Oceanobacillus sp. AG TaxID=2681969 RepID=UPI0012EB380C|nr:hypothetical protein [Oceanobacillus sp. AG]